MVISRSRVTMVQPHTCTMLPNINCSEAMSNQNYDLIKLLSNHPHVCPDMVKVKLQGDTAWFIFNYISNTCVQF